MNTINIIVITLLIECLVRSAINRLYVQTHNLVLYADVTKKILVNEMERPVCYIFLQLLQIDFCRLLYLLDET